MTEVLNMIIPFLAENLGVILASIVATILGLIYKGNENKKDAIESIRSAIAKFYQDNPEIKLSLLDGKIKKEEWEVLFTKVGPQAVRVATDGGAKVLKRWIEKETVAHKYIEAVAREIAEEFSVKGID
jgi:hypothetical protein